MSSFDRSVLRNLGSRLRGNDGRFRLVAAAALVLTLSACGFQLRGDMVIPFKEVHVSAPVNSPIALDLSKKIQSSNAKLATDIAKADARVQIIEESRDKIILSLSGAGRVREYQLKLRVVYTLLDAKGAVLIARTEMNLNRIMSFDDAFVLAKQQEEVLLYKDMENDVVQQILRRVALAQPAA